MTASDGEAGDGLGSAVAISGGTIVAGAPFAAIGSHHFQGSTYVFLKPANGWSNETDTAKLTASDGRYKSEFGSSVSISGNEVAVGAPYQPIGASQSQGATYVFAKPVNGWTNKTQNIRLTASDGTDGRLGASTATGGNVVVGGAPGVIIDAGAEQFGAMYVFGPAQSKAATRRPPKSTPAR